MPKERVKRKKVDVYTGSGWIKYNLPVVDNSGYKSFEKSMIEPTSNMVTDMCDFTNPPGKKHPSK
ncbi:MAG: hypothetical protein V3U72_04715 [Candidatus Aenigmarchaeota archaeon]